MCLGMTEVTGFNKIRQRIKEKLGGSLVKNVATLATGTAASQVITMIFAPFITRVYGPEAYGLQGVFISTVGLMTTLAALSYPIAIILPRCDRDALSVAKLSIIVSLIITTVVFIVILFYGNDLLSITHTEILVPFINLVPIAMISSVFASVLNQWLIRKNAFKVTAVFGVVNTLVLNGLKMLGGLVSPIAMVLISSNIIGGILGTALTYIAWKCVSKRNHNDCDKETMQVQIKGKWELAKEYSDFPILRTPQNLINAASQSLPIFLLAAFFGASSAGHYTIALTVLGVPSGLIAGSVMSVFYPKVTKAFHSGEDIRKLIIKATIAMAAVGVFPFILVIAYGPELFQFVFGKEWSVAGEYAQLLSFWLFLQYINKPAVSAIPALRIQGGLLLYELFSTGAKIIALWIGFSVFKSDIAAIAAFSFSGVVAYIWLIYWVIKRAGDRNNEPR